MRDFNTTSDEMQISLRGFSRNLRSALRDSRNYPEPPGAVEEIETHFALVYLTDHHAYKVKKPILWHDMDFRTLAARRFHCEEEIRLNRQFAPAVYVGVQTIASDSAGGLIWNISDAVEEHVVVMRRLPAARMLDTLLMQRSLRAAEFHALTQMIFRFHQRYAVLEMPDVDYLGHLRRYINLHHEILARPRYRLPMDLLRALQEHQLLTLEHHATAIRQRAQRGYIRECHGDLRPEHICLLDTPCAIDCLEFSRSLRTMDVLEEWALLCMECIRLGHVQFASALASAALGEDAVSNEVWAFYLSKRALAKAKLFIWHLDDPDYADSRRWPELAESCLELGLAALEKA